MRNCKSCSGRGTQAAMFIDRDGWLTILHRHDEAYVVTATNGTESRGELLSCGAGDVLAVFAEGRWGMTEAFLAAFGDWR